MSTPIETINQAARLVVKIGSSLLLQNDTLNRDWLAAMAQDLAKLSKDGKKLIVVSSGAVSLGCASLGLKRRQLTLKKARPLPARRIGPRLASGFGQTGLGSGTNFADRRRY